MNTQCMRTPRWYFDLLDGMFGPFDLDVAASGTNALCRTYYTESMDGLSQPWRGKVFCNPPFRQAGLWVDKAARSIQSGTCESVTMILPVGCSQRWYQDRVLRGEGYGVEVLCPNRRISFDTPDGTSTDGMNRDTIVVFFCSVPGFSVKSLDVGAS